MQHAQQLQRSVETSRHAGQISVRGVSKAFGVVAALDHVYLDVQPGEFAAIVGPSGCGKSTLLSLIAGLLQPDGGDIWLHGAPVTARLGGVALMPQRDALLPWRTVLDNAVLSVEIDGRSRAGARDRARELLPRFGLEGFGDHYPAALSGGMRQRAAFLRTVLTDQDILLLDEPFGALDALTRRSMQEWLLDLWDELGRTILMVTHDVEEALLLSDHVAVMTARPGRIKRVDPVHLPRPRHADMVTDHALVQQKAHLLAALKDEVTLTGEPGARR